MRRVAAFVVLIGAMASVRTTAAVPGTGRSATQKPTEIEGTWLGKTIVRDGQSRQLADGEVRFTFRGNAMLAVGLAGPREIELHLSVDSSANPRRLDYGLADGPVVKAIYALDGRDLVIAIPKPGAERPTSLVSTAGSGLTVFRLVRASGGA